MEQQEFVGLNSIHNLKEILSSHSPKNIFLVTGKASYEKCGARAIFDSILKNYSITRFYDFGANPKLNDIEKGIKMFKENNCGFVIAAGGGSVMDASKSINILSNNDNEPIEYIKNPKKIKNKGKTLIAIPTTSGSGSEATHFAVVYIDKTKYSLVHEFMLPDYSIVDYQFTLSLPKSVTASSGMDALCQGIESYWCIYSTDESKHYAKEAIKLARELGLAVTPGANGKMWFRLGDLVV